MLLTFFLIKPIFHIFYSHIAYILIFWILNRHKTNNNFNLFIIIPYIYIYIYTLHNYIDFFSCTPLALSLERSPLRSNIAQGWLRSQTKPYISLSISNYYLTKCKSNYTTNNVSSSFANIKLPLDILRLMTCMV